ncbi:MAG: PQQ-binding-like beta-propeller repeat protein [Acidobacteria bacterium]|nr:PQQ-binding-like beta-propeller repeat protein [Acidobacteriota bacterium]
MLLIATLSSSALATPPPGQIELSQPLTLQWLYASEQTLNLTPATDGARVYLPLTAGVVVSLRAADGQLLWKSDTGGEISASPAADERGVYVASESQTNSSNGVRTTAGGVIRAISRESGVTLWARPLPMPLRGALAVNQELIFGGASDGHIYAIRKSNGEILWSQNVNSQLASQLTLVGSRLYIGAEDGKLYVLEQKTGRVLWHYQTQAAVRGRVALADGVVYLGSADGYVYALDEETGDRRWRARTGAGVQSVLSVREGLLVASLDNFVYFLSLTRGDRRWKRQLAGRLSAEPLATFDGVLFTPLSGDSGIVLNLRDGKQLNRLPLGEDSNTAAAPIIAGNMLLVTTRHGLLAFSRPLIATRK